MQVKRIEPIYSGKKDIDAYLKEILIKGEYILDIDNEVIVLPRFVLFIDKIKTEIKRLLSILGYKEIKCGSDKLLENIIEKSLDKKYFLIKEEFNSLNFKSMEISGISSFETAYLAKGEVLTILDTLDRYAKDHLSFPLLFGRDCEGEVYRWYSALPDGTFASIGEITLVNEKTITFKLNFGFVLCLILMHSDQYGVVLPSSLAEHEIIIIPKNKAKLGVLELSKEIKDMLINCVVAIDDENTNFGYKNNFYDRVGIPIKIIVDKEKEIEKIEIVSRWNHERKQVSKESIEKEIMILLKKMKKELYKSASKYVDNDLINEGNIKLVSWCGEDCLEIKEDNYYCIPFHQILSLRHCDFCNNIGKKYLYILKKNKNF